MEELVSVVIVTYNSNEEIGGCIESILRNKIPCKIFIVDNNSKDQTIDTVESYRKSNPGITLIRNTENYGLAFANNQPLENIGSKYILILNPDLILREDSIEKLVDKMERDPSLGMIGPLTLFEGGERHQTAFVNYSLFTILMWRIFPYNLMRKIFDSISSYKTKDVLFVSGACYLIPTKLFKEIGGYDPQLFLTISDVADIGVRIRKRGYRALFYSESVITHFGGRSNAPLKYLTQYWALTGDLYFIRKHKGVIQEKIARIGFITSSLIRFLAFSILGLITFSRVYREKMTLYRDLAKNVWRYKVTP